MAVDGLTHRTDCVDKSRLDCMPKGFSIDRSTWAGKKWRGVNCALPRARWKHTRKHLGERISLAETKSLYKRVIRETNNNPGVQEFPRGKSSSIELTKYERNRSCWIRLELTRFLAKRELFTWTELWKISTNFCSHLCLTRRNKVILGQQLAVGQVSARDLATSTEFLRSHRKCFSVHVSIFAYRHRVEMRLGIKDASFHSSHRSVCYLLFLCIFENRTPIHKGSTTCVDEGIFRRFRFSRGTSPHKTCLRETPGNLFVETISAMWSASIIIESCPEVEPRPELSTCLSQINLHPIVISFRFFASHRGARVVTRFPSTNRYAHRMRTSRSVMLWKPSCCMHSRY